MQDPTLAIIIHSGEDAMGRLEGKIAVITGANSGIGLASAQRFVAEGAHVYITGRRQEELDRAVQAIGAGVTAVQGDVSNLDDLDRLFSKVGSEHGHIDILFANAGLGALEPLGKITEAAFDLVFGVNVKGTVFTVQKGRPQLGARPQGHGHPRERPVARRYRNARPAPRAGEDGQQRRRDCRPGRPDAARTHERPGRYRSRSAFPRLG
jgi:NAD(P)-dependent dehydrogenase (short-subunit alcohol dehydrogenase family)